MQRRERCKDDVFDEAEPREDQLEKEERGEKTLFHIWMYRLKKIKNNDASVHKDVTERTVVTESKQLGKFKLIL